MSNVPLTAALYNWYSNFATNAAQSISYLTLRDYIRLVWLVGGYLFLRPYLDKGFRKMFETDISKTEKVEAQRLSEQQQLHKATLSSAQKEDQESYDDHNHSPARGPQWGKSARRKQQKFLEFLEQEAERQREDDDDKDIAHLLED
ncbi:hypothetical protein LOZ58_003914 [Ophidiomyces ophidiicola]|nr:hypothetical protein LOZ58_003914 [Ophidiomyces ophidiicola]